MRADKPTCAHSTSPLLLPGIDFRSIESNQDLYPQMYPYSDWEFGLESDEAAEQRGLKFLQWLVAR